MSPLTWRSALAGVGFALAATTLNASNRRPLTPADAVETVRIMGNQEHAGLTNVYALLSPHGGRYVLRAVHGDVARNGVWLDILTGRLDSLAAASEIDKAASLFTPGLGCPEEQACSNSDVLPNNELHWIDENRIALLWSDARGTQQVVEVNLQARKVRYLTHSDTSILTFDVSKDETVIYNSREPRREMAESDKMRREGFTVLPGTMGFDILRGNIAGKGGLEALYNEWFIVNSHGKTSRFSIGKEPRDHTGPWYRRVWMSPNGREAITTASVSSTPESWRRYTNPSLITELKMNDTDYRGWMPLQYVVVSVPSGHTRPLSNTPSLPVDVVWSPDSRFVLLTRGCALDTGAEDGVARECATPVVIEVDSGRAEMLPIDLRGLDPLGEEVKSAKWISSRQIELDVASADGADHRVVRFCLSDAGWSEKKGDLKQSRDIQKIQIVVRQNSSTPPKVYAVDSTSGADRLVIDPNPQLDSAFKLGRTARIAGVLSTGQSWIALLFYPADYVVGMRYPLVIQSLHGAEPAQDEFDLYGAWAAAGMGLGPDVIPAYAAQLLAGRGFAVVRLWISGEHAGPSEGSIRQEAFEQVAKKLEGEGLVDGLRVGLVGYSRAGYHVEYTLSHSSFPFAAAIANDNYDPSYIQAALNDWPDFDAREYGAEPFGPGLSVWMKDAPGFNVEKIHAPLLMIGQTPGEAAYILSKWEIFSRLRHLGRPVEMYVMPDIERFPAHEVQSPRQIVAIQEKVVDWFTLWLQGSGLRDRIQ